MKNINENKDIVMKGMKIDDYINIQSDNVKLLIADELEKLSLERKLANLRKELTISQRELSKKMGITASSLSEFEKKVGKDVKISTMKKYIEALGGTLSLTINLPHEKEVHIDL